jgi:hypothetical protein
MTPTDLSSFNQGAFIMPPETTPSIEPSASAEISRRKLLKMITAAGAGASATVLLSSQWVKPVAAGGKLAPHAQVSQPIARTFVSSQAQQIVDQQTFDSTLSTSALITPPDPNIPIIANVYADLQTPTQAPTVDTLLTTLNGNTDGTGTVSFTGIDLTQIDCQNVPPSGSTTVTVVYTFANDPSDGTGSTTAQTPWEVPC